MIQYGPLDPQKSEIRLLTLLPGESQDAIRCTLSTASLDNAPEFTALSYVWGDPSKTIPITVENEPFDATVNLEACLRAIRKRWGLQVLWVDAICINQKDVQEKNVQVPQMRRLYSIAPAVLIWLGPSSLSIEAFVSWTEARATRSHNAASAYWLALDARIARSARMRRDRDWALVRAQEGYYEFMALSYWGRVWTFQEYILPRIEPMCLCGDMEPFQLTAMLEQHNTDTLSEVYYQAMERLKAGYGKGAIMAEAHGILETKKRLKAKIRLERKMDSAASNRLWDLPNYRNYHEERLATLLNHTANRQCFDEHDRIFALYGMVPALQDIYPPDYTKPINDVMLQAATFIVNFEHHVRYLWSNFGLRDDRLSDASRLYPSWVPDFTKTGFTPKCNNLHVMEGELAMPLKMSKDRPAPVSVEHMTLRIWARCLGTCKVAVRFADTPSNILEQIKGLFHGGLLQNITGRPVRRPETLISRITRACVGHHSIASDYSGKEILETFYLFFDAGIDALRVPERSHHQECRRAIEIAMENLTGKELLVTENGCFGISVGGAKDGDIIVIPPEVENPLVLTPESSASADGVGYFKMVGTAIIDGLMEAGELFDEELVEEIAKRDVVEFLIH